MDVIFIRANNYDSKLRKIFLLFTPLIFPHTIKFIFRHVSFTNWIFPSDSHDCSTFACLVSLQSKRKNNRMKNPWKTRNFSIICQTIFPALETLIKLTFIKITISEPVAVRDNLQELLTSAMDVNKGKREENFDPSTSALNC